MSGDASVVFEDALTKYDFGAGHPMAPVRVDLTMRLARELGVLDAPGLRVSGAAPATEELLETVHAPAYIEAVQAVSADPYRQDLARGLGSEDNPTFEGMHEASAHIVGASVEAARQVWTRERLHAVNVSGGLHHAMAGSASGFCVYNDAAVAIRWLLDQGAERVAYVDIDVHHGDGVQAAFYDDPRVLTVSLHESPRTLFPGTGMPDETGGPGAPGSAVNVTLPPGTGDGGWLRAFHAVVPEALRAFQPEILVTQHGCDSHMDDPMAHLMLSLDGQRGAHAALHRLAHEVCDGRWVALGGGGYAVVDVVPRSWTHLLAIVAGAEVDEQTETPSGWQAHVELVAGRRGPSRMTDGRHALFADWSQGYNPESWLDRCVHQTRQTCFPLLGIPLTGY